MGEGQATRGGEPLEDNGGSFTLGEIGKMLEEAKEKLPLTPEEKEAYEGRMEIETAVRARASMIYDSERGLLEEFFSTHLGDKDLEEGKRLEEAVQTGQCVLVDGRPVWLDGRG